MSLKNIAKETLGILEAGQYTTNSGKTIHLSAEQDSAVHGSLLYTPDQGNALLESPSPLEGRRPVLEVTGETTQVAARRLLEEEQCKDLLLLNFASAVHPGGGFLHGAKAQEEDLARCSGLYPCLLTQPT